MSNYAAGSCGKCGAPYFLPTVWHGTMPPQPQPSCQCWNIPRVATSTEATVSLGASRDPNDVREIERLKSSLPGYRDRLSILSERIEKRLDTARSENEKHGTVLVTEDYEVVTKECGLR